MPNKPYVTFEASQVQDFPSYERLLWHTLATLARRGYFVPPDEGRDVIHDFYVEAWEGLQRRYDPVLSAFPAYVAGAFYKFARRRLVELNVWRNRLVDIDLVLEHPSDAPSPAEEAQSAEEIARVRLALESLPGNQRQALVEYLDHSRPSERAVALRQRKSRHAVRRALAEGIANLCVAFEHAGLSKTNVQVAQLAWRDGRVSPDISNRVNLSTREVQLKRKQLASELLTALRTYQAPAIEGESTMGFADFLKNILLNSDREQAADLLRSHAESVRRALSGPEADQFRLAPEEAALLEQHPERLGEFYEILFPEQGREAAPDSAAAAIARYEHDKTSELALAFEDMVVALPPGLQEWSSHFEKPKLSDAQVNHLLRKPAMARAGESARALACYGLTPEIFAETFGGFALLFRVRERHEDYQPQQSDEVSLALATQGRHVSIALEDLVTQTQETPGLPEFDGMAIQLTRWTLSALNVLPLLVPGYRVSTREGSVPLAARAPDNGMSLAARWTRLATP